MWNSLPDSVVMADTVNQFKNRLDKHWANYAFLYDYRQPAAFKNQLDRLAPVACRMP